MTFTARILVIAVALAAMVATPTVAPDDLGDTPVVAAFAPASAEAHTFYTCRRYSFRHDWNWYIRYIRQERYMWRDGRRYTLYRIHEHVPAYYGRLHTVRTNCGTYWLA